MEIRKLIKNAILYTVTLLILYVVAMFLLYKMKVGNIPLVYRTSDVISWKGGNSYRKFLDFDKNKKYDVIVLGSSHAYRGYDPRIFEKNGITMFNLGTSGQSLLNSYYIAKNYITSENCKLVILDIYDGALASDGMESSADLVQNISSDCAAAEMGFALKDPRVFNMLTVRMLAKSDPAMYVDSSYVSSGYSEKSDTLKYFDSKAYNPKLTINERQVGYLKGLLNYFMTKNIKVVAVTHPAPKETEKETPAKFYNLVSGIAAKYKLPYFNYSNSLLLDTRLDYYDSHHLNQAGVEKFNAVLLKDLKEQGYFN